MQVLNISLRGVLGTRNKSKSHDCKCNLSPMILKGNQMVYSWNYSKNFLRLKAREIKRILTKRKWNYSLISRVHHLITHTNFPNSKLKVSSPEYYKESFDAWSDLNGKTPSSYRDIINELIWNNRFLCHDKKSMYSRDIVNLGFVKIGDLITENHSFLYGINPLLNPEQRFFSWVLSIQSLQNGVLLWKLLRMCQWVTLFQMPQL